MKQKGTLMTTLEAVPAIGIEKPAKPKLLATPPRKEGETWLVKLVVVVGDPEDGRAPLDEHGPWINREPEPQQVTRIRNTLISPGVKGGDRLLRVSYDRRGLTIIDITLGA